MPDDPVPITPTRLPVKSTPACGQCAVWYTSPSKESSPSIGGMFAFDSGPTAKITKRADTTSPVSVRTSHRSVSSSRIASVTRVPKVMSRPQVEAVGDVVEVTQNLRLGGVPLAPVPLLLELRRRRSTSSPRSRRRTAPRGSGSSTTRRRPRPRPRTPHGQPVAAQPVQGVEAGEPRAYHDCIDVPAHSANGTGRTAPRMPIVPLCGNCRPGSGTRCGCLNPCRPQT